MKNKNYWENWNPHIYTMPIYIGTLLKCLIKFMNPMDILKANYKFDCGGVSLSKYDDFNSLNDQSYFLKYDLIKTNEDILIKVEQFLKKNNLDYPVILKPNNGRTGMGIIKVENKKHLIDLKSKIIEPMMIQEYCNKKEFGVFFYRLKGKAKIFSINSKELPYVIGNGKDNVFDLVNNDPFLKNYSYYFRKHFNYIPKNKEKFILLYIGNHSKGCVFKDIPVLNTDKLVNLLDKISGKGYNYGRFDVMSQDINSLKEGKIKIIEVNGIHSLSTSYLDPKNSLLKALKILNKQSSILVKVAYENRKKKRNMTFNQFLKLNLLREKSISKIEESIRNQA
jgi:hypothetical protein